MCSFRFWPYNHSWNFESSSQQIGTPAAALSHGLVSLQNLQVAKVTLSRLLNLHGPKQWMQPAFSEFRQVTFRFRHGQKLTCFSFGFDSFLNVILTWKQKGTFGWVYLFSSKKQNSGRLKRFSYFWMVSFQNLQEAKVTLSRLLNLHGPKQWMQPAVSEFRQVTFRFKMYVSVLQWDK